MAYFGGRAKCRIKCLPIPVVYLDFFSMYPKANALMGLWRYLTAKAMEIREATPAVQQFLDSISPEDLFNPAT